MSNETSVEFEGGEEDCLIEVRSRRRSTPRSMHPQCAVIARGGPSGRRRRALVALILSAAGRVRASRRWRRRRGGRIGEQRIYGYATALLCGRCVTFKWLRKARTVALHRALGCSASERASDCAHTRTHTRTHICCANRYERQMDLSRTMFMWVSCEIIYVR